MPEYIEREDAIRMTVEAVVEVFDCHITLPLLKVSNKIRTIPTADVAEVKHGYWINTAPYRAVNGNYNKAQECSACLAYFVSDGNTPYSNHPYCCKCGAKMDLKEGAENGE